jgi:hypothetical protein
MSREPFVLLLSTAVPSDIGLDVLPVELPVTMVDCTVEFVTLVLGGVPSDIGLDVFARVVLLPVKLS